MAQTKKNSTNRGTSAQGKKNTGRNYQKKNSNAGRNVRSSEPMDTAIKDEILLIALFAVCVFLFLCNFGIIGVVGNAISDVMFGIFGMTAYVMPVLLFLMIAFGMVNSGNVIATRKLISGVVLFVIIGMIFELFTGAPEAAQSYQIAEIYKTLGEKEKTLETYWKEYDLRYKVLGEEHPSTIRALGSLATANLDFGNDEMALKQYKQIYQSRSKIFGEDHLETVMSKKILRAIQKRLEEST